MLDQHSQKPVEDAKIRVTPTGKAQYSTYKTNESGHVFLTLLPGEYTLTAERPGYHPLNTTFEISRSTASFPTLFLSPKKDFLGQTVFIKHALATTAQYLTTSVNQFLHSNIAYTATNITTGIIALLSLIILIPYYLHKKPKSQPHPIRFLLQQTFLYITNLSITLTLIINLLFILIYPKNIHFFALLPFLIILLTSIIRILYSYRDTSIKR